jgi:probable rRNA maturation factor
MRRIVFSKGNYWCKRNHIDKKALKFTLEQISLDTGFHVEHMSYVIVSDAEILQINKQYLNHNYFTDIITFDLNEKPNNVNGEAYISKDTIEKNAQHYARPIYEEFARVVIHGFLHLVGYNDKSNSEKETMRLKEDFYLFHLSQYKKTINEF